MVGKSAIGRVELMPWNPVPRVSGHCLAMGVILMSDDDATMPARRSTLSLRASPELRPQPSTHAPMGRRNAVSGVTAVALFSLAMVLPRSAGEQRQETGTAFRPRHLDLVVTHTGEVFRGTIGEGERHDARQLARLNRLLRDYSTGEVKAIDPRLFDILCEVQARIRQPLQILSGYRSWRTNRFLHIVGFDVAEHSLHVAGKAVDFMVPGVPAAALADVARQCDAGGVGIYRSGFIHVDTGARRNWAGN
jgi:uncharacterized protein YcbK (DUF882 family)